ncbi:MAG: methyl-accepting chemotaxis protein [Treponema sp.]|jgi:methyl-accepting chemotaxis protein|nr:methyl-accepting chemotaxis protein [Treponema sp.]
MKISVKLVTTISVINLIGIGLLAGVTLFQSQREISRLVDEQANSLAAQTGEKIRNWFGEYMDAARSLAQVMEAYKEIPVEQRREHFNLMMRQLVLNSPVVENMYANWSPDGLDGMDAQFANTPGTDETGRFISSWYKDSGQVKLMGIQGFSWEAVLQGTSRQEYMLDPALYLYSGSQRKTLIANMGVPVTDKDTGALIGVIGAGCELSTVQTMVEAIKPFGDGQSYLFSSGGIVAAHSDSSRLGKDMRQSESDTFGPFLNTMVEAVSTGTVASFSYRPSQSDTVMQYYAVPFTVGHTPNPWTLVIGVSRNTIMAPVYRMMLAAGIIGIATVILMSVGVVFTARSISRPIAHTMIGLKDIAEGDLTKDISVHSRDELGDLVHYLNFTVDKIKRLIVTIKKEALSLTQTGTELAANMKESAISINEISSNFQTVMECMLSETTGFETNVEAMEEVTKNIETFNTQIEKQTSYVSQSSTAVEEMLANVQSVTQTLVDNEENIAKLAETSEIGRNGLLEVASDIQEIARESEGLLEINTVMENIASQTNLLSMNAAIEAAHAGEAGKGFAVVAEEIRKLAESSDEQSKTISGILQKIKSSIDKIMKSTEKVQWKFEAIREGVMKVTEQETIVRIAMEKQDEGSKSILESISGLNETTNEVTKSAHVIENRSHEVIKESRALEALVKEISGNMQEMASGIKQIDTAVNRVNDISMENKNQIGILMTEVSRFKLA